MEIIVKRLQPSNRVNRFTDVSYNNAASSITSVEKRTTEPKKVRVHTTKGATNISSIIKEILEKNSLKPNKTTSPSKKLIIFTFDDKNKAQNAYDLICNIQGDEINPSSYDPSNPLNVKTRNGLKLKLTQAEQIEETVDPNTGQVVQTFNYKTSSPNQIAAANQAAASGSGSKMGIIIAAVAALLLIGGVVLFIIKKKKK